MILGVDRRGPVVVVGGERDLDAATPRGDASRTWAQYVALSKGDREALRELFDGVTPESQGSDLTILCLDLVRMVSALYEALRMDPDGFETWVAENIRQNAERYDRVGW